MIVRCTGYLADKMRGDHLFGSTVGAADHYLFVRLLWAKETAAKSPDGLLILLPTGQRDAYLDTNVSSGTGV